MAHRKVDAEIERLSLLRDAPPAEAESAVRKALADRVNLVAAKAAKLAAELQLRVLTPDLVKAFDRLMENPVERDPQCWGKNAIAKALTDLGHTESAVFLRGIGHVQLEAVWGGREDTASNLRGLCVLGLVACTDVQREVAMRALVDALAEGAFTVRVEAARALAQMDGEEAALLLRLKARVGDRELPVVGQVFDSLLSLEREAAVDFVASFVNAGGEGVPEEAAMALGSSRLPAAADALRGVWEKSKDRDVRHLALRGLSASRLDAALEFLAGQVREARLQDAKDALEVLSLHKESDEIRKMSREAAEARGSDLRGEFERLFK